MRHSVGDRRQQSKAPPLCANHTCILTYILPELILNDPNLLFSLHLLVVVPVYHLPLVIYGSFLRVTQWQMHVTLQRRLRDLICEKDF